MQFLQQIYVKNIHLAHGSGIQTHNLLIMSLVLGITTGPRGPAYLSHISYLVTYNDQDFN